MGAPAQPSTGTSKASRDSFGEALVRLGETHPELVVLDADLSESTRSGKFANIAERSGRAQDKAGGGGLETLRRDGYM